MATKHLLALFLTIGLVLGESVENAAAAGSPRKSGDKKKKEKTEAESQCTACDVPDYAPQIASLDSQMQNVLDNLDFSVIKGYGSSISDLKAELSKLTSKLKALDNAKTGEQLSKLTQSVKTVQKSLSDIQKSHQSTTSNVDTTTAALKAQIESLEKQLKYELKAHSEKVDNLEQLSSKSSNSDHGDSSESVQKIEKQVEKLEAKLTSMEKKIGKFEKQHKEMRIGVKAVEKLIAEQNKQIKRVHEATLGAMAKKYLKVTGDFLFGLGEKVLVKGQEVGQRVMEMARDVDWKGYYEAMVVVMVQGGEWVMESVQSIDWKGYVDTATDPKTYVGLVEWFQGMWAFCDDWWMNGIQPTIIRQANEASVWIRLTARDVTDTIHGHLVYLEMVKQITPYMEMASIPMEYKGMVVDGLLVIALLSLLWTIKVILCLMCDCCCPLKKIQDQPRQPQRNGIANGAANGQHVKGRKSRPEKKGKKSHQK